jgi:hypothetical protein
MHQIDDENLSIDKVIFFLCLLEYTGHKNGPSLLHQFYLQLLVPNFYLVPNLNDNVLLLQRACLFDFLDLSLLSLLKVSQKISILLNRRESSHLAIYVLPIKLILSLHRLSRIARQPIAIWLFLQRRRWLGIRLANFSAIF